MKLTSTRNPKLETTSLNALIHPLSPDGGLWAFESFPLIEWKTWIHESFEVIVKNVLNTFIQEIEDNHTDDAINHAYRQFTHPEIVPSVFKRFQIVELFHGPSAAFKDIALTLLPGLTKVAYNQTNNNELPHILTATSGDTGSAALMGFGSQGFDITVFYPEIGISTIQRKQMTCVNYKGVRVYGIKGNFDDAQKVVKHIFKQDFEHRFGSANSINIGRLLPQIAYYFKAYGDAVKTKRIEEGEFLSFSVPSGNFGNAFAGYCAMRLGLPIRHLIIGSNENDVLTDFFNQGIYDANKQFKLTQSPSMDILVSSNLERLLHAESNSEKVNQLMKELELNKLYKIDDEMRDTLTQHFKAYSISEDEMLDTIKNTYHNEQYCLDPHTAIAWASAIHYQVEYPKQKVTVLSTASPYKFPSTVLKALEIDSSMDDFDNLERLYQIIKDPIPFCLSSLKSKKEIHTQVLSVDQAEKIYD